MEFDTRNTTISEGELRHARNAIEYDAYILLCILTSSKFLHANKRRIFGLFIQLMDFEKSEVNRIVFSLSLRVRNYTDKNKTIIISQIVGTQSEKDKSEKPLTLKEACNKIIHSEHINFDLINPKTDYDHNGIGETIYVYGKKGKVEWKAIINLFEFVSKSMEVLFS